MVILDAVFDEELFIVTGRYDRSIFQRNDREIFASFFIGPLETDRPRFVRTVGSGTDDIAAETHQRVSASALLEFINDLVSDIALADGAESDGLLLTDLAEISAVFLFSVDQVVVDIKALLISASLGTRCSG